MRRTEQRPALWMIVCLALAVGVWTGCQQVQSEEEVEAKANRTAEVKPACDAQPAPDADTQQNTGTKEPQKPQTEEPRKDAEPAATGMLTVTSDETPAIGYEALMAQREARQKAMLEKLREDPAWQGTHDEVAVIDPVPDSGANAIHNFCLNVDGNLLVCCGGELAEIRVLRPDGQLVTKWELPSQPQAICVHRDGTIFVAGDGRVLKLSQEGEVLAAVDSPALADVEPQAEEPEDEAGEEAVEEDEVEEEEKTESKSVLKVLVEALVGGDSGSGPMEPESTEEQRKAMEEMMKQRRRAVTGIAVSEQDVFVACPARKGYGYCVWRLDHNLESPEEIVDGLRGCCGQMDIQAHDGELWVPENGRHRVLRYDRDGKQLTTFGKRGRNKPEAFGGCCEPKNLRFGSDGSLYTSESGPPMVVKRFSPEGEFMGVVGLPSFQTGCVRVTVEVSRDGDRVYVLNTDGNKIHVLADGRRRTPTHKQVATIELPKKYPRGMLHTLCLSPEGNLLVAVGGERVSYTMGPNGREAKVVAAQAGILVMSPDGKLLATWEVDMTPQAFDMAEDGTVFVGGDGRLVRLGTDGKVQQAADSPHVADLPPVPPKPETPAETKELTEEEKKAKEAEIAKIREELQTCMEALQKAARQLNENKDDKDLQAKYQETIKAYTAAREELQKLTTSPQMLAAQKRAAAIRKRKVSSIAATGDDVFVCCPASAGYGFDVWRTDRDFGNGEKIVTGLRGCCGNMYIQAHDGELWVAENARKRVIRYDRDGKELARWGSSDRKAIEGFGSCCNPMCIRIGSDGMVYTSEASLGRIKRYSPEGELLGLVGTAEIVPGCKHVPIGVTADGGRMYMLDLTRSHVLVMEPIKTEAVARAD